MTDIIPKSVDQLNQSNLGDKKLSREEIGYLRNQEQLWYSNVGEKLFQDIIETNKRLLSSDKVLGSFIDEILSNPTTMKQIAYKAGIKLGSKQLALLGDDAPEKKYEKYSILVHMLLIGCNAMPEVKTNLVNNINNLLYTESTIKSLHRFQKQGAKMNGWSKADCLIGKKTMQQMLAKMGIQGVRTKVDSKFASSNITAKNNYERNGEQQKQMDKIINDPILSDAEKTKKLLEVAKKTVTKGTDGLDKKYGAVSYMLTRISDKLMRDRSEEEVQVIIDTLKGDPEGLQLIKKYWNENSAKQFGANPTLIKKTNNWIADLNERKEIVIDKRKNVKAMIGGYKSYLEKLSQDYKGFDWATDVDEKLQVHVKKIDKLLYEINNTNLYQDDALLAKAFINIMNDPHSQKILNDPMTKIFIKDKTQGSYQYEYYLTYNEMQKLISNPSGWGEEGKTKFVQLLRRMDKYDDSTLLLSSYESSEATKDLSKDAVDKSMTNNEDTKNKLKEMNDLFTSDKEGNYTPAFEKLVSYIDQGNEDEARKFIKEQIQGISTDDHRYPNFIGGNDYIDDLMDSVKSLNETEKETKKDIESGLEEEIQKLIKMEENGTLNRQGTEQLVKLREAKGNKTLNILIDDSYKQIKYAMISSSIGHELRSQMLDKYPSLFTAGSGSLVDSYANVVGAGDYLSDKTVESIQSTTVQIIIQVILAIFSFGIANAVEATLAGSIARFAGKEVATTLAKNLIYKSAMLLTKGLVYTATTAAGNAVMQAKDIGEIGTIWQKGMSLENILGNTAMIGILGTLKNISMIGKALKTGEITGKTGFLIKNGIGKFISKGLSNNIARVGVEEISINLSQGASKIIFGDGNYTTQDFLEASAQGLAFELIPGVGEIKFRKDKKNSMNVTTMVNGKVYEGHPDKILNDIKNDHPGHQINSNGSNGNNVLKGDLNSTKGDNGIEIKKENRLKNKIDEQFQKTPAQKKLDNRNKRYEKQDKFELLVLQAQQLISEVELSLKGVKKPLTKVMHTLQKAGDISQLSPNDIKRVQKEIGAKPDGIRGPKSLNRLSSYFDTQLSGNKNHLNTIVDVKIKETLTPSGSSELFNIKNDLKLAMTHIGITKGNIVSIEGKKHQFIGVKEGKAHFVEQGIKNAEPKVYKNLESMKDIVREVGIKKTNAGRQEKFDELNNTKEDLITDADQNNTNPLTDAFERKSNDTLFKSLDDAAVKGDTLGDIISIPKTSLEAKNNVEKFGFWLGKTTVGPTLKFCNDALKWLRSIELNFPDLNLQKKIDSIRKNLLEKTFKKGIEDIPTIEVKNNNINTPKDNAIKIEPFEMVRFEQATIDGGYADKLRASRVYFSKFFDQNISFDSNIMRTMMEEMHIISSYKDSKIGDVGKIRTANVRGGTRTRAIEYVNEIAKKLGLGDVSTTNIAQTQYADFNNFNTLFERAGENLNNIKKELLSGKPDNQKIINLIADYYHDMIFARPMGNVNNSMIMNQVNYLLKLSGNNGISHSQLDHIATRVDKSQFRKVFNSNLKEELPQSIDGLKNDDASESVVDLQKSKWQTFKSGEDGNFKSEDESNIRVVKDEDIQVVEDKDIQVVEDKAIQVVEDKDIQVVEDKDIQVVEDKDIQVVEDKDIRKDIECIKMREKTLNDIYHETEIYRSQINNFKSFPNINMVVKARYIPSHKYEISFYAQNNKTFLETYCPESIRGNQEFVGNILFKFNLEKTRLKYAILDASQYSHKSYLAEINLSHFEVDYNGLSQTYIDILKTELPMIEDIYRISGLPEHIDYNQIKIMQEYDISLEELDAFYGYKGTDYSDINEFMRFARGKKNKILDPLLSGLNKLPNTEGTFYRQINFNEISYNKFLKDMRERKESKMLWSDKGIMSVSSSDQIHQSMSRGSQYEIEILIESNTAKDIRSLNLNKSEDEFLITPGKEFEVVNIIENSKSGTAEIHLRQVEMNELDLGSYDIGQNIIIPRSDGTISEGKINSYDSNSGNYIVTWSDSKGSYKKSLTKEQLNNVNVLNGRMDPKITKNKSNMSVIN